MDTCTQVTELLPVKGPTGTKPKRQYRPTESWQASADSMHEIQCWINTHIESGIGETMNHWPFHPWHALVGQLDFEWIRGILIGKRLPMYFRMILWIPALAYVGCILMISNRVSSPGMFITTAFLGALLGLLLAAMFTLRECRRENGAKRRT